MKILRTVEVHELIVEETETVTIVHRRKRWAFGDKAPDVGCADA